MDGETDRVGLIRELHSQSTWQLLLLSLVTFGVYTSYYTRNQTRIINRHLSEVDALPEGFTVAIIVLAWASLAMLVPYIVVDEGHPV